MLSDYGTESFHGSNESARGLVETAGCKVQPNSILAKKENKY